MIIKALYRLSRIFGKAAATVNDLKVLSSGDPIKIAKRMARKVSTKTAYEMSREINKHLR